MSREGEEKMAKTAEIAKTDEGLQLQALLAGIQSGEVDMSVLAEALGKSGMKVVAKGVSESKYSRAAVKEKWLSAKELDTDELAIVENLPKVLGKSVTMLSEADTRALTPLEIDTLAEEELARRKTEDIVKGRYNAIRTTMLNYATFMNDGDEYATGEFASLKTGFKFVVGKSERGGEANYTKLQETVSEDVWEGITDEVTTRVVNEEKLITALGEGKITYEQFESIVPAKSISRTFTIKEIKEGDDV